ncbi:MAG TPA: putative nucleotidyltransferase substrate binding domain-containing protein [Thiolinea sp.]|nr:putative nucleotidyltransferase substrate binding domain-containing protein [Thiolinea sp.]
MEIEQLEIRDYLAQCPPLTELPDEVLNELAMGLEIQYARRDTNVLTIGAHNGHALLIRSGAVEVTLENGELYGQLSEGDWVGHRSVIRGGTVSMTVRTLEDTLFYAIPAPLFLKFMENHERVRRYFTERKPERLRNAIEEMRGSEGLALATQRISELMKLPLLAGRNHTIRELAVQMNEANAQSAMIVSDDGALNGIITDVDFRKRVVAEGRSVDIPVTDIMTPDPLTLKPGNQASDALLLMARRNIRHVPVVDNGQVVGVVSATDLLRSQSQSTIYLVGDISAAKDVARLEALSKSLPKMLVTLVNQSMTARDIGHAITSIGQAITRRLLALAEQQFGPPPIPYAFIVAGSMARREQTAHSDQDNGMILSDDYHEAEHGDYFRNVAKFVSDGLNAAGYVYCPGDIMATNDQWRQPWSVWNGYFTQWIESPQPKALMYSSIFFDLRCLYGDASLLERLQTGILSRTREQTLFQAFMAGNAMSHRPPLGFFRGFVLEKDRKNASADEGMDLKKRGVVPVIDMARLYALAGGLAPINTWERLDAIAEAKVLTPSRVDDLRDAFEFISMVRLQHQAQQIEKGRAPNNYVPPEELSSLERRHLKDAFDVVSSLQDSMASHYQTDRFR